MDFDIAKIFGAAGDGIAMEHPEQRTIIVWQTVLLVLLNLLAGRGTLVVLAPAAAWGTNFATFKAALRLAGADYVVP